MNGGALPAAQPPTLCLGRATASPMWCPYLMALALAAKLCCSLASRGWAGTIHLRFHKKQSLWQTATTVTSHNTVMYVGWVRLCVVAHVDMAILACRSASKHCVASLRAQGLGSWSFMRCHPDTTCTKIPQALTALWAWQAHENGHIMSVGARGNYVWALGAHR